MRPGCPRLHLDPTDAAWEFASRISSRQSASSQVNFVWYPNSKLAFTGSFGLIGFNASETPIGVVKIAIQKSYHRNGQLREVVPLRNGRRHGVVQVWHKNGVLANQEPYQNGLLHGICRQWNESGKLLGKYRMVHGTGIQRAWHENGRLQLEFSTVRGDFSGRYRMWLHDGALLSEDIYLHGRPVSAQEYRGASAEDKSLPKLAGKAGKPLIKSTATDKHAHEVFIRFLLGHKHRSEARKWLESGHQDARSLGRFKRADDALKFVAELYKAGATEVIAPDIYHGKNGNQFADCLLARLPKTAAKRKAIRKVCGQLSKRKLGAFLPDKDFGESHLYLSLA